MNKSRTLMTTNHNPYHLISEPLEINNRTTKQKTPTIFSIETDPSTTCPKNLKETQLTDRQKRYLLMTS